MDFNTFVDQLVEGKIVIDEKTVSGEGAYFNKALDALHAKKKAAEAAAAGKPHNPGLEKAAEEARKKNMGK